MFWQTSSASQLHFPQRKRSNLINDFENYIKPLLELNLPAKVLDELPVNTLNSEELLLTHEVWKEVVGKAYLHGEGNLRQVLKFVAAGVRETLIEAGLDYKDFCCPATTEQMKIVARSPYFIQEAEWLTTDEQVWLAQKEVDEGHEFADQAKCETCETLRKSRTGNRQKKSKKSPQAINEVFEVHLQELMSSTINEQERKLFEDKEALFSDEPFGEYYGDQSGQNQWSDSR